MQTKNGLHFHLVSQDLQKAYTSIVWSGLGWICNRYCGPTELMKAFKTVTDLQTKANC